LLLPRRHVVPTAAAGPVPGRVPPRRLLVVEVEQDGLNLLYLPRLHGEELRHETIECRDGARVLDRAVETAEAQDRQHDAAFLVDDGVAAVPKIAADEAALVET